MHHGIIEAMCKTTFLSNTRFGIDIGFLKIINSFEARVTQRNKKLTLMNLLNALILLNYRNQSVFL